MLGHEVLLRGRGQLEVVSGRGGHCSVLPVVMGQRPSLCLEWVSVWAVSECD